MSSYKERWFADYERRLGDYEAEGVDFDEASTRAADEAYDALTEAPSDIDRFDTMTAEDIEHAAEEAAWRRERDSHQ